MENKNSNSNYDIRKKLAFAAHYVLMSVILTMAVYAFCGDDMKLMASKIMLGIIIVVLYGTLRKVDGRRTADRIMRSAAVSALAAALGYWLVFVKFTAMKEIVRIIVLAVLLLISLIL